MQHRLRRLDEEVAVRHLGVCIDDQAVAAGLHRGPERDVRSLARIGRGAPAGGLQALPIQPFPPPPPDGRPHGVRPALRSVFERFSALPRPPRPLPGALRGTPPLSPPLLPLGALPVEPPPPPAPPPLWFEPPPFRVPVPWAVRPPGLRAARGFRLGCRHLRR